MSDTNQRGQMPSPMSRSIIINHATTSVAVGASISADSLMSRARNRAISGRLSMSEYRAIEDELIGVLNHMRDEVKRIGKVLDSAVSNGNRNRPGKSNKAKRTGSGNFMPVSNGKGKSNNKAKSDSQASPKPAEKKTPAKAKESSPSKKTAAPKKAPAKKATAPKSKTAAKASTPASKPSTAAKPSAAEAKEASSSTAANDTAPTTIKSRTAVKN